ncbi:MAG: hypothetical protein HQL30_01835 [Candidatus Omnitrophica bacterium]|nr:hypothetical protein [Candidatus Omnitrophota bacterium]
MFLINNSFSKLIKKIVNISTVITFSLDVTGYSMVNTAVVNPAIIANKSVSKKIVDDFILPENLGTIKEKYFNDSLFKAKDLKNNLVIHIQDAHCNYNAQIKIASLLEYLKEKFNIKVINLEGGSGEYEFTTFYSIKDEKIREKVADSIMRDGELSGAEYFAINNKEKIYSWGVEDKELYLANLYSYRDWCGSEGAVLTDLEKLEHSAMEYAAKNCSDLVIALLLNKSEYRSKKMEFKEYLLRITRAARYSGIDIGDYPSISRLLKVVAMEKYIDFAKANKERDEIIDRVLKILSRSEVNEFREKLILFKNKDIPENDFYEYLLYKAGCMGIEIADNANLRKYLYYIKRYAQLDNSVLMDEIENIERAMLNYGQSEHVSGIIQVLEILDKVSDIVKLELTSKDYGEYKVNKESFDTPVFVKLLRALPDNNFNNEDEKAAERVLDYAKHISMFFAYSFERDEAFVRNIRYSAGEGSDPGNKITVLLTGGFHGENMANIMRKRGCNFISIVPVFKTGDQPKDYYHSFLKGEISGVYQEYMKNVGISTLAVASMNNILGKDLRLGMSETLDIVAGIRAARLEQASGKLLIGYKIKDREGVFSYFNMDGSNISSGKIVDENQYYSIEPIYSVKSLESPDMSDNDLSHKATNEKLLDLIKGESVYLYNRNDIYPETYIPDLETKGYHGSEHYKYLGIPKNRAATVKEMRAKYDMKLGLLNANNSDYKYKKVLEYPIFMDYSPEEKKKLIDIAMRIRINIVAGRYSLFDGGPLLHARRGNYSLKGNLGQSAIWIGEKALDSLRDEEILMALLEEAQHILYPERVHGDGGPKAGQITHSGYLKYKLSLLSKKSGERINGSLDNTELAPDDTVLPDFSNYSPEGISNDVRSIYDTGTGAKSAESDGTLIEMAKRDRKDYEKYVVDFESEVERMKSESIALSVDYPQKSDLDLMLKNEMPVPESYRIPVRIYGIFTRLTDVMKEHIQGYEDYSGELFFMDTNEANAFVLRGDRNVYFGKGLYELMVKTAAAIDSGKPLTEDAIAFIIAHEMGHLIQNTSKTGLTLSEGYYENAPDYLKKMARNEEDDADRWGLFLMDRANYSVMGAIQAMKCLEFVRKNAKDTAILDSHPYTSDRRRAITDRIENQNWEIYPNATNETVPMDDLPPKYEYSREIDQEYLINGSYEDIEAFIGKAETTDQVISGMAALGVKKQMELVNVLRMDREIRVQFLKKIFIEAAINMVQNYCSSNIGGSWEIVNDEFRKNTVNYSDLSLAAVISEYGPAGLISSASVDPKKIVSSDSNKPYDIDRNIEKIRKQSQEPGYDIYKANIQEVIDALAAINGILSSLDAGMLDDLLVDPENLRNVQTFSTTDENSCIYGVGTKPVKTGLTNLISDPKTLISGYLYSRFIGKTGMTTKIDKIGFARTRTDNRLFVEAPERWDMSDPDKRHKMKEVLLVKYIIASADLNVCVKYAFKDQFDPAKFNLAGQDQFDTSLQNKALEKMIVNDKEPIKDWLKIAVLRMEVNNMLGLTKSIGELDKNTIDRILDRQIVKHGMSGDQEKIISFKRDMLECFGPREEIVTECKMLVRKAINGEEDLAQIKEKIRVLLDEARTNMGSAIKTFNVPDGLIDDFIVELAGTLYPGDVLIGSVYRVDSMERFILDMDLCCRKNANDPLRRDEGLSRIMNESGFFKEIENIMEADDLVERYGKKTSEKLKDCYKWYMESGVARNNHHDLERIVSIMANKYLISHRSRSPETSSIFRHETGLDYRVRGYELYDPVMSSFSFDDLLECDDNTAINIFEEISELEKAKQQAEPNVTSVTHQMIEGFTRKQLEDNGNDPSNIFTLMGKLLMKQRCGLMDNALIRRSSGRIIDDTLLGITMRFLNDFRSDNGSVIKWFNGMFLENNALSYIERYILRYAELYKYELETRLKGKTMLKNIPTALQVVHEDMLIGLCEYLLMSSSEKYIPQGRIAGMYLRLLEKKNKINAAAELSDEHREIVHKALDLVARSSPMSVSFQFPIAFNPASGNHDLLHDETNIDIKETVINVDPKVQYFGWNMERYEATSVFVTALGEYTEEELRELMESRAIYLKKVSDQKYRGERIALPTNDTLTQLIQVLILNKAAENANPDTAKSGRSDLEKIADAFSFTAACELRKDRDRRPDCKEIATQWQCVTLKYDMRDYLRIEPDTFFRMLSEIKEPTGELENIIEKYVEHHKLFSLYPLFAHLLLRPETATGIYESLIKAVNQARPIGLEKVHYRKILSSVMNVNCPLRRLFNKYVQTQGEGYLFGEIKDLAARVKWLEGTVKMPKSITRDNIIDLWESYDFSEVIAGMSDEKAMIANLRLGKTGVDDMWDMVSTISDDVGKLKNIHDTLDLPKDALMKRLAFYTDMIGKVLSPQRRNRYGAMAFLIWERLNKEEYEKDLSGTVEVLLRFMPEPSELRDKIVMEIIGSISRDVEDITKGASLLTDNNILFKNRDTQREDSVFDGLAAMFSNVSREERKDILLWLQGSRGGKPGCVSKIEDKFNISFEGLPEDLRLMPETLRNKFIDEMMYGDNGVMSLSLEEEVKGKNGNNGGEIVKLQDTTRQYLEKFFDEHFKDNSQQFRDELRVLKRAFVLMMEAFTPVRRVKVMKALIDASMDPDFDKMHLGRKLAVLAGTGGPVLIKGGQYLSENETLVPQETMRRELGRVRNSAPKVSKIAQVGTIVRNTPRKGIQVVEVNNSLGEASIKQVNRGKWLDIFAVVNDLLEAIKASKEVSSGEDEKQLRKEVDGFLGKKERAMQDWESLIDTVGDISEKYGITLSDKKVRLKYSRDVVYKVVRPELDVSLINDYVALDYISANMANEYLRGNPIPTKDMAETVKDWIGIEKDLNNEYRFDNDIKGLDGDPEMEEFASELKKLGLDFRHPEIFFHNEKVMVEECVKGVSLVETSSGDEKLIREKLEQTGFYKKGSEDFDNAMEVINNAVKNHKDVNAIMRKILLWQIFEKGLFHADLHQGNVMISGDGGIYMIDRGNVGRLNKQQLEGAKKILKGVLLGNMKTTTDNTTGVDSIVDGIKMIFENAVYPDGVSPAISAVKREDIKKIIDDAELRKDDLRKVILRIASKTLESGRNNQGGKDLSTFMKAMTQAMYLFPVDSTNGLETFRDLSRYIGLSDEDIMTALDQQKDRIPADNGLGTFEEKAKGSGVALSMDDLYLTLQNKLSVSLGKIYFVGWLSRHFETIWQNIFKKRFYDTKNWIIENRERLFDEYLLGFIKSRDVNLVEFIEARSTPEELRKIYMDYLGDRMKKGKISRFEKYITIFLFSIGRPILSEVASGMIEDIKKQQNILKPVLMAKALNYMRVRTRFSGEVTGLEDGNTHDSDALDTEERGVVPDRRISKITGDPVQDGREKVFFDDIGEGAVLPVALPAEDENGGRLSLKGADELESVPTEVKDNDKIIRAIQVLLSHIRKRDENYILLMPKPDEDISFFNRAMKVWKIARGSLEKDYQISNLTIRFYDKDNIGQLVQKTSQEAGKGSRVLMFVNENEEKEIALKKGIEKTEKNGMMYFNDVPCIMERYDEKGINKCMIGTHITIGLGLTDLIYNKYADNDANKYAIINGLAELLARLGDPKSAEEILKDENAWKTLVNGEHFIEIKAFSSEEVEAQFEAIEEVARSL